MHRTNLGRYNNYIYLFLSGLLLILIVFIWKKFDESGKPRILLIHSFDQSYFWTKDFNEGAKDGFRFSKLSVDIESYHWPANLKDRQQKTAALSDLLNSYGSNPPDLIITCDNEATSGLLNTKHAISNEVPIVFCGVDYINPTLFNGHSNITGFTDAPDFIKCYKLARQLFGHISYVTLVAEDDTYAGRSFMQEARKQYASLPNLTMIEESFPTHQRIDTLSEARSLVNPFSLHIERVDQLTGRALKDVLYYRLYSFCILTKWDTSYSNLVRMGTAPFLMVTNDGFGDGRIGGYMTTGYDQTYQAAIAGAKLLSGTPIEDIPITQSSQSPVFDWDQLSFWKIDLKLLPADAIIPNMPFFIKYKQSVTSGGIIAGLFLILFFSLLMRLYKRESYYKKKAQKKLRKEQKELDITMDSLSEGVVSFDMDGRLLSVNSAAIKYLDLDKAQSYTGHYVWSLFDIQEQDNPSYFRNIIDTFRDPDGKGLKMNAKLSDIAYAVTSTQKMFPVSCSVSSLDSEGKRDGVVVSFRDITSEYTQKQFLALSMISGNIFAWRFDQQERVLLYDATYFEAFNFPHNEANAISYEQFRSSIHPEDLPACLAILDDLLSKKVNKAAIPFRMKMPDGEYQWWEYCLSQVPSIISEGRYVFFGICVNIDQYKQREEELIHLRDEAEKSDQLKNIFMSNMSHEVRTPLNSIVGFSSILSDNPDLSWEDRKEFIDIINENCRLLLNLINEILDLSRIESGIYFRNEPCDLHLVVKEATAMNEATRPESVTLVMDIPTEPLFVLGDNYRLLQVYSNLLNNAYKFTKKGMVTVGYHADKSEETLTLFVKDTGVGIKEDVLETIFERFYKSNDFTQGGGLGLSIVQEIVKRLNGTIEVRSKENQGSIFEIRLPWSNPAKNNVQRESDDR